MILDPAWEKMVATGSLDGRCVHFQAQTDSTNDDALALVRQGAASGTMVVADLQFKGRGRLGREWLSPPGIGIYCSIILRPALESADLPKLTLAAGVAASRAVESVTALRPLLKWPNDLWLNEKKIGGILAEARFDQAAPVVILGIGLNVNTSPESLPPELHRKATSLFIHSGQEFTRSSLLAALADEVAAAAGRLERKGFSEILTEWRALDAIQGRELEWLTQTGQVVRGQSLGLNEDGLLQIRDAFGLIHGVISGDISLAGKPVADQS